MEVLTLEWFGYVWLCFPVNSKAMKYFKKNLNNLQSAKVDDNVDAMTCNCIHCSWFVLRSAFVSILLSILTRESYAI